MLPPNGGYPPSDIYAPSSIGMSNSTNSSYNFLAGSNIPGYPHPLYSMNSAYDYNAYGNIPPNYPPFNSSSSVLFFLKNFFFLFFLDYFRNLLTCEAIDFYLESKFLILFE